MILRSLVLQHFRNYTQAKFDFDEHMTVVVGPNTAGKTNLTEAIQLLSTGKSFRGQSDRELIQFEQEIARVQGLIGENELGIRNYELGEGDSSTKLEVVVLSPEINNGRFGKKFLMNGVGKSRNGFVGHVPVVVFRPEELDIVIAGPSLRRQFLDDVLQNIDREYYQAIGGYEKALRQRNALLRLTREMGYKNHEQFAYWDELLIRYGSIMHQKRKELIEYFNATQKDVVEFAIIYDHSIISQERLQQYESEEIASGNTLVGPHRDDFYFLMKDKKSKTRDVKTYGSRGQQRLVVFQLKLLQIAYTAEALQVKPLLVLDDIFSELDTGHIELVLEKIAGQQVIMTTTHKEFLPQNLDIHMIELKP